MKRTFAWISKHRRTVRDYEQLPESHEAMILWAMIALMTHRANFILLVMGSSRSDYGPACLLGAWQSPW